MGGSNVKCRSDFFQNKIKEISHVMGGKRLIVVQSRSFRMPQVCNLPFGRLELPRRMSGVVSSENELRRMYRVCWDGIEKIK